MPVSCPNLKCFAICACVWLLVSGCKSSELTRDRAKQIIESSKEYSEASADFILNADDMKRGIELGYWTQQNAPFGGYILTLTSAGKKLFVSVGPKNFVDNRPQITTVAKIKKTVRAVTGITDAPELLSGGKGTSKIVEFWWSFDKKALPVDLQDFPPVKRQIEQRKVLLRLYDDGWRLENSL